MFSFPEQQSHLKTGVLLQQSLSFKSCPPLMKESTIIKLLLMIMEESATNTDFQIEKKKNLSRTNVNLSQCLVITVSQIRLVCFMMVKLQFLTNCGKNLE